MAKQLAASQIQQSWAYTHDVNLLAAGASRPSLSNTGSGIYSGRMGAIESIMADTPSTRILIANISRSPDTVDVVDSSEADRIPAPVHLKVWKENLASYTMEALDFDKNASLSGKVCSGQFCCEYNISTSLRDREPARTTVS